MRTGSSLVLLVALAAPPAVVAQSDEVAQLVTRVLAGPSADADRAAERLSYLGARRAGPPLRALLASPDPHAHLAASSALILVHDPGSAALLQRVLADEDWETRRNAATALGGIKAKSAVPALEKTLRKDAKDKVRLACVKALLAIGGGGAGLADASVKDAAFEVRMAALDALAHLKDRRVRARVRLLLKDKSELIRFTAARTLAWQDDPVGRQFVEKAFTSRNIEDVRRAVTVAADVPAPWVFSLLERGLRHSDVGVACAAAVALARRHDVRGLRHLAKLAGQDSREGLLARHTLEDLGIVGEERQRLAGESP